MANESLGLATKYFVLKPRAGEGAVSAAYASASRKAMLAYADAIEMLNPGLADDLRDWVERESR
jgi:hypothetical protein